MNSLSWLEYFRQNQHSHVEPAWHLPSPDEPALRRKLARSLCHFQLGESGDGRALFRRADREAAHDAPYREALRLFIAEENEHARLLARLVERLGGKVIHRHWSHSAFRLLRRLLGLDFELQVLVTAELVGTAYYRVLRQRTRDPVLEQACAIFLHDEAPHIAFHRDHFAGRLARLLPLERSWWLGQFQVLFLLILQAAWWDHRECLQALGATKAEFTREARREGRALLASLQGSAGAWSPAHQVP